MKFGIYRLNGITDEVSLKGLDDELGVPVAIRSFYRAWSRCRIADDLDWLQELTASSRDILLTWEPWQLPGQGRRPEDQPDFSLRQILSGRYDSYIRDMASILGGLSNRIYLRPMHEMNGNWYPWCGTVNGNRPGDYIETWRYLRRLFAAEGATGILWVWSPYVMSFPSKLDNAVAAYFPGDEALDVVGLDGYNWGNQLEGGKWQSFAELFDEAYETVCRLSCKKIMIAETACTPSGGEKAGWIDEMLSRLTMGYDRLESLVWFDINKECDWRIASSDEVLALFRHRGPQVFE